jgi:hypothetical protein
VQKKFLWKDLMERDHLEDGRVWEDNIKVHLPEVR